ncbi:MULTISPECIES: hypothetical protein [unclassified Brevibacillus]|uniref:hypothetical protein n=1 Tax=unclassified Brevibacillus TaxID=2684853 RepID=UPI003568A56A
MKQAHELIIEKIKAEFEQNDLKSDSTEFDTNVWVLAVAAIPFEESIENSAFLPYSIEGTIGYIEQMDEPAKNYYLSQGTPTDIVRVILGMSTKAGTSPYVDGTDVYLVVDVEKQQAEFIWEEVWMEGPPKFHGGTVPDALKWVKQMVEPFYIQYEALTK